MSDWRKWYGLRVWRRRAERQLQDEPRCEDCLARGIVRAAREADHVEPHLGDYDKFMNGRLQSRCSSCHAAQTRADEQERKTGKVRLRPGCSPDGLPLDARHPWHQY